MSTNDKTNPKLDKKNNDEAIEAIVEVSPTEADAVAGGIGQSFPPSDREPFEADPKP